MRFIIGSLSSHEHDDDDKENVTSKHKFVLLELIHDYSNLFSLYNVTQLFRN